MSQLPANITFRLTTVYDAKAIREFRLLALRTAPAAFGGDYEQQKRQPDTYWLEYVTPAPQEGAIHIAQCGQDIIGMTGIRRRVNPKTEHSATIWGVFVHPAWQRQGIASALLKASFDWAQTRAITIVKLAVVTSNQPAIKAYERLGFKVYGTEPKAILYNGEFYDEYLMYCEL